MLRSISEVVEIKKGRGRTFGNHLQGLLTEAMELWQAFHRVEAVDFATQAERLRRQVACLPPGPSPHRPGQLEAAERTGLAQ